MGLMPSAQLVFGGGREYLLFPKLPHVFLPLAAKAPGLILADNEMVPVTFHAHKASHCFGTQVSRGPKAEQS